jgi:hypothetical protein
MTTSSSSSVPSRSAASSSSSEPTAIGLPRSLPLSEEEKEEYVVDKVGVGTSMTTSPSSLRTTVGGTEKEGEEGERGEAGSRKAS